MRHGLMLLGLAAAVALLPGTGVAQQGGDPSRERPDSLVFEREVFAYPQYDRRNPFSPLVNDATSGPRFEQLRLLSIAYFEGNPELSVATLSTTPAQGTRRANSTYRVRVGERVGNSLVLEILPRSVVLEVDEFGITERRVLEIRSRTGGQGGPS